MPDDPRVIRGIDFKGVFPFTLIFRSFRIAVHPSKLILALAALVMIYVGGRVMDYLTPTRFAAVPNELGLYGESWSGANPAETFRKLRDDQWEEIRRDHRNRLAAIGKPEGQGSLNDIKVDIAHRRDVAARAAEDEYNRSKKTAGDKVERDNRVAQAYVDAAREWEMAKSYNGVGLFSTFYDFELGSINTIVRGVREWNWLGRFGVVDGLRGFFVVAPAWAIIRHPVFFTIFLLYFLVIWSIFGGAISRIAAVHVARDEKISIRQALRFSTAKFLSFFSAPLIPVIIILAVGLVVALGGFIINIPVIGPIIVGALFFLALAAGFVMALVLIGLVGGFNLMYPTIAVEGSDSFDAISRSFSYLYARPWRLIFYTAVAIAYGALTYMFVRYFLYILLTLTHRFAGLFVFYRADNYASLWNMLWPSPSSVGRLAYPVQTFSLSGAQTLGAGLIALWVYLVVFMLGAFVISFYFSANTIIYYLMRNEVDATELDDVYLEQSPEDLVDTTTPAGAATATTGATTTVVTPASGEMAGQPESPVGTAAPVEGASTPEVRDEPPV